MSGGRMAGKHWKLEVSELGGKTVLFDEVLSAPTWLAALQAGRGQMGEQGGIPSGASCNVAPNGIVMIQDARARRRYRLVPTETPAAAPRPDVAPQPARAKPLPAPRPQRSTPKKKSSFPPPPKGLALGRLSKRPRPSSPPVAMAERALVTIASRNEAPTEESPIHFRERQYAVSKALHPGTAEMLGTKLLKGMKQELADTDGEKFVRVEIYDHVWRDKPAQRPVVRLEWKSWNKTTDIQFPLEDSGRSVGSPAVNATAPPVQEDRLTLSFEACRDLLFLSDLSEAMEFAARLIDDMIAPQATAACLFDIETDEFRFVATRGVGAKERKAEAVPSTAGLFGAASKLNGRNALELNDATKDALFSSDVDAIRGLDVRSVLYKPLHHEDRLFGMLQLANGVGMGGFTDSDCKVVDYIAEQLAEFVKRTATR